MKKTIVTIPFHFDRDENPFVLFDKIILDILEFYKEKKYDRIVDILTSYLGVNDHQCIPILDLKTRHGIERQRVEQILFLEIGLKRLFFEKHYNVFLEMMKKIPTYEDGWYRNIDLKEVLFFENMQRRDLFFLIQS
jgi:hypothetical protein